MGLRTIPAAVEGHPVGGWKTHEKIIAPHRRPTRNTEQCHFGQMVRSPQVLLTEARSARFFKEENGLMAVENMRNFFTTLTSGADEIVWKGALENVGY